MASAHSVVKGIPPLKTCLILNPRSGAAAAVQPAVRAFAAHHGAKLLCTARPHHAADLTRQALAEGCELIVAVGGDGTINEIASVLVGTGVLLGLVPCGSGNGLGRQLGIHGSVHKALHVLEHGKPHLIDSGLADGHPFFVVAGVGFEAVIAERFNRLARRGFAGYLVLATRAFFTWRAQEYSIVHPGGREVRRAFTVAVANSSQYGNRAYIAPGARPDDGRLDLCAVPAINPWNALPLVVRLFSGRLDRAPGIFLRQGVRFVVERPEAGPLQTDGETHQAGRCVEFSVRPASLRILVPASSPFLVNSSLPTLPAAR